MSSSGSLEQVTICCQIVKQYIWSKSIPNCLIVKLHAWIVTIMISNTKINNVIACLLDVVIIILSVSNGIYIKNWFLHSLAIQTLLMKEHVIFAFMCISEGALREYRNIKGTTHVCHGWHLTMYHDTINLTLGCLTFLHDSCFSTCWHNSQKGNVSYFFTYWHNLGTTILGLHKGYQRTSKAGHWCFATISYMHNI